MLRYHRFVRLLVTIILPGVFVVSGCSSKGASKGDGGESAKSSIENTIDASGSTFVAPLMVRWVDSYQKLHPKTSIKYRPIGSGAGIDEFRQQLTEFAASDAPLSDKQVAEMISLVQIPVIAGPVCVIYNLPELKSPLRLSPATVAGIFLGKIVTWQDASIAADNPGVNLPHAPVIVVHRADRSGTTNIFTNYLSTVSPEWSKNVGAGLSVEWPVGMSGEGSKRVIDMLKQTVGTVAYAELTYATHNNIPAAAIRNRSGEFVKPSSKTTTAAIDAFSEPLAKDPRTPIIDPPPSAKDAYPISGLSFLIVRKDRPDASRQQAVRDFISYTITAGQDSAEELSYAKLTAAVQQQAQNLLAELTVNGQPLR